METRPPWQQYFPQACEWDSPLNIGTLDVLLRDSVATFADRPAFDFRGRTLSFRSFGDMVDRLAAGLLAHGVGRGESIAVYLPNTLFHPLAFFAIARTGARIVHLSPLDAPRELRHKLKLARATRMITTNQAGFLPKALDLLDSGDLSILWVGDDALWGPSPVQPLEIPPVSGLHLLSKLMDVLVPDAWPALRTDDVAVLQFTGGTTGWPKAAMLSHGNLSAACDMYRHWFEDEPVTPGEGKAIGVLPLFHIYALTAVLLRNIRDGHQILLHERFDIDAVLNDITVKRATAFAAVPTMWVALLNKPGAAALDFTSLKSCVSGGAPLPNDVKLRLEALIGNRLCNGWGMTETSPAGTRVPASAVSRPGLIGIPLAGVDLRVVSMDDPLRVLPPGEIGELAIRGPNVFKGYFTDLEASKDAFADGYFLTGDIGRMDAQGLFDIVDRRKNMIISGGFNVYPAAVEDAIYEHPAVAEVIVIGIADDYRGQAAKAFVTLKAGAEPFTVEDLQAFLADRLGRHEMPRHLEFRAALPRSAAGKLLARVLVEEEAARAPIPVPPEKSSIA